MPPLKRCPSCGRKYTKEEWQKGNHRCQQSEKASGHGRCLACGGYISRDEKVYVGCIHVQCGWLEKKQQQPELTDFGNWLRDYAAVYKMESKCKETGLVYCNLLACAKKLDSIDRQAAENKRLQFEIDRLNSTEFISLCRKNIKDNKRLKELLESIKAIEDQWDNCIPECDVCYRVQEIVEHALKQEKGE